MALAYAQRELIEPEAAELPPLWPHQQRALDDLAPRVLSYPDDSPPRIVVCSPTGGGKTRIMAELAKLALERGRWTVIYTNRRWLVEQTIKKVVQAGLDVGVRAAGHQANLMRPLQISSVQTEVSRVYKQQRWYLHPAKLVLVDEAHIQKGDYICDIMREHHSKGAAIVGFTATPAGLGGLYDEIYYAGTPEELRECGALVPAIIYAPDEPVRKTLQKLVSGEFKHAWGAPVRAAIWGRVWDWFCKLNDGRPAILFAPGVPESLWFARQFEAKGVTAAHVDAKTIYVDGKEYDSTPELRDELAERSRDGDVKLVCNRFVMREGVDWPWLSHGILACVFGTPVSYIQAVGRLLRSSPGKDKAIISDHGGNWWRHGSPNVAREWHLDISASSHRDMRIDRLREGKERQPIRCPQCGLVRAAGRICPKCGFYSLHSVRPVVQVNGTIRMVKGDPVWPVKRRKRPNVEEVWKRYYWRAYNSQKMTFRQAEGLFVVEQGYWPPRDLPLMPKETLDWYRLVCEVPKSRLR